MALRRLDGRRRLTIAALAALALVAGPGARAATQRTTGFSFSATHGAYRLRGSLSPNSALRGNTLVVTLRIHGRPAPAGLRVGAAMPTMPMGSETFTLVRAAVGTYELSGFFLPMYGRWRLEVTVRPRGGGAFRIAVWDTVRT